MKERAFVTVPLANLGVEVEAPLKTEIEAQKITKLQHIW
jgi:hypothetical protein